MDSRLKKLSLLGCIGVAVLIILVVIGANGGFSGKKISNNQNTVPNQEATSSTDPVSGQVGNNLKAFENDNTFFDQDTNAFVEDALDDSNRLYLVATSVEKDLRIQILDTYDRLAKGLDITVKLTDPDGGVAEYKDLDNDGIIYAGALKSGDYSILLLPVSGYKIPVNAITIKVKDKVEYTPIDDIDLLMVNARDVSEPDEDTYSWDAENNADPSENQALLQTGAHQKVGIDVSSADGDIDWEKVAKSGVSFAIIRAGYRGTDTGSIIKDSKFETNIKGAYAAGLDVGVYFVSQATTETEAVEEASAVLKLANSYEISFPVYMVLGPTGGESDGLSSLERSLMCEAFCRTVVNAGYEAGVCGSVSWLQNNLDKNTLKKYETWLSEYAEIPTYDEYYTMWQHSSKGQIEGVENPVHLDVFYF